MVELPAGPNGGRSNYDYYDTLEKGVPTHSGHLRGPLPLKITLFGATSCISLAWFCIPKALATWRGEGVVVPSWQWLFVVLICILTYWSQKATPPVWPWFFHRDHSPSIVLFLRLWAIGTSAGGRSQRS
ncbi:hypothetical protein BC834DRAFT_179377 [Gloeopeniophorella convolvens]|nr:hypothetical protein BC834DRAFT_179377 [Gloeopeniophorella convolvens]